MYDYIHIYIYIYVYLYSYKADSRGSGEIGGGGSDAPPGGICHLSSSSPKARKHTISHKIRITGRGCRLPLRVLYKDHSALIMKSAV